MQVEQMDKKPIEKEVIKAYESTDGNYVRVLNTGVVDLFDNNELKVLDQEQFELSELSSIINEFDNQVKAFENNIKE